MLGGGQGEEASAGRVREWGRCRGGRQLAGVREARIDAPPLAASLNINSSRSFTYNCCVSEFKAAIDAKSAGLSLSFRERQTFGLNLALTRPDRWRPPRPGTAAVNKQREQAKTAIKRSGIDEIRVAATGVQVVGRRAR